MFGVAQDAGCCLKSGSLLSSSKRRVNGVCYEADEFHGKLHTALACMRILLS